MNKILKGNLVFLSILLLLILVFIKNYNKIILFILILTFYLEIIFITREFLKYINLDEVTKEKKVSNRGYNKNKFIKKVFSGEKLDPLRNIYTRFEVKNNLEMWKGPYTLFLIDLRKFSLINDALGRDKGDEALREFGKVLSNISKSLSTKNLYGVYEGDEFLIAINSNNKQDIIELLNKLEVLKELNLNSLNKQIEIGFNIGYSINLGNKSFEEIIEEVFFAKEMAKKESFSSSMEYTETLKDIRIKNNLIKKDIKDVLINKKLYTVYQPQISSLDNKIKGYETLIRWDHEILGSIPASDIVKTLEEIDSIKDLDLYVFESTCEFQSRLIQNNIELQCSVNISINTLKHRGVGSNLYKISKKYNLKPENITLEILENADLEVSGNAINEIIKLKKYGFKISIDDFGKGYSSINRVLKIPFDQIKIPKDFISDIPNSKYIAIINSISNFAKTLGAELVIEGVESKEYYDFFKLLDFDIIQGFYFSKALNEKEFLEYVNNLGVSISI
ncbi:EAL domain-containing protein [Clostridium perfringens]